LSLGSFCLLVVGWWNFKKIWKWLVQ
jgi:hypothetical protein